MVDLYILFLSCPLACQWYAFLFFLQRFYIQSSRCVIFCFLSQRHLFFGMVVFYIPMSESCPLSMVSLRFTFLCFFEKKNGLFCGHVHPLVVRNRRTNPNQTHRIWFPISLGLGRFIQASEYICACLLLLKIPEVYCLDFYLRHIFHPPSGENVVRCPYW